MNRVELAIQENRCVIAFGARALQDADNLGELRRRGGIPSVVLSGEAVSPAQVVSAATLAPALREGGVIVLVEADTADGAGLGVLANAVAASPHKPRLVVVARAFNPFALPAALRTLKFEHERKKVREFLFSLPVPAALAAAPVAEEPKKKSSGAPRVQFVGREDELAALKGMLEEGGPVVIHGAPGVGKRWLVEQALMGTSFERHPDFLVDRGCEADALYARIAMAGERAGDGRLAEALRSSTNRPAPQALATMAAEIFGRLPNAVLVIDRVARVLRADGTLHREGRFELLLRALMLGTGRVVFLSAIRPRFYREGEGASLKILDLAGLKGRELHQIFDAYRVEDFARENFGPIQERIHGHPLAARMFAIAMRDMEAREDLLAQPRFMKMDDVTHVEVLRRRITKQLEACTDEERAALVQLAHFRMPYTTADADVVKVDRAVRLGLQARGLLDQLPDTGGERTWQVHPLVADLLPARETSDFALLEALGDHYLARASKADGLQKLALAQEGNRMLFEAHRTRNRMRMPFPDNDPALESLRGLIRGRKARLDLAEQRVNETLKLDPANTELLLMRAELLVAVQAGAEKIVDAFAAAQAQPTPEAFHLEANLYTGKARAKAAAVLARGCAAFPESGRLRRRLAGVLVELNRLEEAVTVLREAMDLEPMMPDTYGLLGEIHLVRGNLEAAEEALAEARRLDPDNALHMARLGALLVERGNLDDERAKQAEELLTAAISADAKAYAAHLYLGRLLLERDGDLERAEWALKKAHKLDERAAAPLVLLGRVAMKADKLDEAQNLLDQAARRDGGYHPTFHALGELAFHRGNPFLALAEFQRAIERSPRDAAARPRYQADADKMKALIESGAYVEVQKAWEAAQLEKAEKAAARDAATREASGLSGEVAPAAGGARKAVRRRRGGRGRGGAEAGGADGAVEGGEAVEADENGGELPATEAEAPAQAGDAVLAEAEAAGFEPGEA